MTTRDQIHKWFFYALGLFLVWVLDAQILNRLPVLGTIPMLLPLAVVSVAVLEVLDGLRILRILFLQAETLDVLLRIAVPEIALSLCWTPVVYWIFRRIYRRVGGTKLA